MYNEKNIYCNNIQSGVFMLFLPVLDFSVTIPVPTVIIPIFAVGAVLLIVKVVLSFVRGK